MKLYREIEKIFPILGERFNAEDFEEFKNTRISDLCLYHFGFGAWIRNNLLYNSESILYSDFIENGIEDKDEMSAVIIRLFHYYATIYSAPS